MMGDECEVRVLVGLHRTREGKRQPELAMNTFVDDGCARQDETDHIEQIVEDRDGTAVDSVPTVKGTKVKK